MKWASETKRETYLIHVSAVHGDGLQSGSDEGISRFASVHCRGVSNVERREKRTKWKDHRGGVSAEEHVDTRNVSEKVGVDGYVIAEEAFGVHPGKDGDEITKEFISGFDGLGKFQVS